MSNSIYSIPDYAKDVQLKTTRLRRLLGVLMTFVVIMIVSTLHFNNLTAVVSTTVRACAVWQNRLVALWASCNNHLLQSEVAGAAALMRRGAAMAR